MIDLHTHILPGIDDGSADVQESLQLLQLLAGQGVHTVCATPHFYATRTSPEKFLAKRQAAWEQLQPHLTPGLPQVRLGAEVYYFDGITASEELSQLHLQGTNLLLLEMPFRAWSSHMIDDIFELAAYGEHTVVLAHINRYLKDNPADLWAELQSAGVVLQVNANFFDGGWLQRRQAMGLVKKGIVQVLGSDCHNLTSRRPNLDLAAANITKGAGKPALDKLMANAAALL